MKTNHTKLALLILLAAGIQSQSQAQPARAWATAAAHRAATPQIRQMRSQMVGMQRGQATHRQSATAYRSYPAQSGTAARTSLKPQASQTGKSNARTAGSIASHYTTPRNPADPSQTWTNTLGRIYSQDGRSFMNPTVSTRSGQLQRGKVYHLTDGTTARYLGSDGYTSARGTPTYQFSRFQVVQSQGKQSQQPSARQSQASSKPASRRSSAHQSGGDIMILPETSEVKSALEDF